MLEKRKIYTISIFIDQNSDACDCTKYIRHCMHGQNQLDLTSKL